MNDTGIPPVAIIGLGNVLLGDDGIGCLAVQALSTEYDFGPEVEIIDLGAAGLDLAPYLYGRKLAAIVDAVNASGQPGTVKTYGEDDFAGSRAQLRITDHDPGLHEALAQLRLVGHAPEELIVIGVIPGSCALGDGITSAVQAAVPIVIDSVLRLLLERGHVYQKRLSHSGPTGILLWPNVHGKAEEKPCTN